MVGTSGSEYETICSTVTPDGTTEDLYAMMQNEEKRSWWWKRCGTEWMERVLSLALCSKGKVFAERLDFPHFELTVAVTDFLRVNPFAATNFFRNVALKFMKLSTELGN